MSCVHPQTTFVLLGPLIGCLSESPLGSLLGGEVVGLLGTSYNSSNDVCNGGLSADTAVHEHKRGTSIVFDKILYLQLLLSVAVM